MYRTYSHRMRSFVYMKYYSEREWMSLCQCVWYGNTCDNIYASLSEHNNGSKWCTSCKWHQPSCAACKCIGAYMCSLAAAMCIFLSLCVCMWSPKKIDNKCENTAYTEEKKHSHLYYEFKRGKKMKTNRCNHLVICAHTVQMSVREVETWTIDDRMVCRKRIDSTNVCSLFRTIRNDLYGELANFEHTLYALVCVFVSVSAFLSRSFARTLSFSLLRICVCIRVCAYEFIHNILCVFFLLFSFGISIVQMHVRERQQAPINRYIHSKWKERK